MADWATAARAYAAADGFPDSAARLLHARGRDAAEAGRTAEALTHLTAAAAAGRDTEPLLGELRERAYEAARAATEAGDWAAVLTHLAPMPADHRATRALRRYAEGRSAMAEGDWSTAEEAFGAAAGRSRPRTRRRRGGRGG
ncbi:hypothetical protein SALBM135S_08703 [Streptomyces alboniger]